MVDSIVWKLDPRREMICRDSSSCLRERTICSVYVVSCGFERSPGNDSTHSLFLPIFAVFVFSKRFKLL